MANMKTVNNTVRDLNPIPQPYELTVGDVLQLLDIANREDMINAVTAAFRYGYVMGNHATVNRKLPLLKVPLK